MLQAVQSVQWTYSLFWQFCPQQGILVWGDGYYNGAIKTRKTVQPMELPGKAYARRQHVWLTGANEIDSKTFSRAILAKVQEDLGFVQQVKGFFIDHHHPPLPPPPKQALSEHSTSNPATSSDQPHFHPPIPSIYGATDPQAETGRNTRSVATQAQNAETVTTAEPSELMQLEMSEDIRLGSPDDGSNNLESDFHLIGSENPADHQNRGDSFRAESARRTTSTPRDAAGRHSLLPNFSAILQSQRIRWAESSSSAYLSYSNQSAFTKWTNRCSDHVLHFSVEGTSQWFLKYILFSVPYLHHKYREENSPKSRDGDSANRFRKGGAPQDELSANHVLAERRRREKLNERFIILRSLVPFVTKMDKASILGDTIEYVKQLRKKIQELEARNRHMEIEQRSRLAEPPRRTSSLKEQRSTVTVTDRARNGPGSDKRKLRIVEVSGGCAKPKTVETSELMEAETNVEVSIIECDALLEIQCGYREGLLLDIMQMLRELRIETTAVQSSLNNGVFVAELRAKVKDNVAGKKVSIVEVKRAIRQIIPHD
ncbi:hypothetical protein GH714_037068 [Hevea brasiliensis]|uniref:BHLH domain-containing protein n=1 Tax=Hevea brasiliensis TaxID=3981 RepID=A0A6A6MPG1_HEVBR|nr:hypothetical protein GH714_037068 [Hevea brasiliensis]